VHVLTAVIAGVHAVPLGAAWVGITALQLVRVATGLDRTLEIILRRLRQTVHPVYSI